MNGYPYPVLTEIDSSYKDDINFNIEFNKYNINNNKVSLIIGVSLNSSFLRESIEKGNAQLVIKTVTGIQSKLHPVSGLTDFAEIVIEGQNIRANDVIEITAYIIVKTPFVLYANDEIKDYFNADYSIELRKGDLLAVSNVEKLNYNTTNNDFIKIIGNPTRNGLGIQIRLNENNIEILTGDEYKRSYAAVKDPKISPILNSHIVFEAIVYALIEIVQHNDEYTDCEWYRLFSQAFLVTGDSIEIFRDKALEGDGGIDISYIYEAAQLMINNSLESSVISVSRMGDAQ